MRLSPHLALAALCLARLASAFPSELLADLADNSICQSEVVYDEDPARVPRIIKEVKCAASPDKMCPARDGKGGEKSCCTQNSYLDFSFSCKEVVDSVLVSDAAGATHPKVVSVGCACAMTRSLSAIEIDNR